MTPFSGQTEKAGHFLQPTARAIGHNVIAQLLSSHSDPGWNCFGETDRFATAEAAHAEE
jgi:hypothetical protein